MIRFQHRGNGELIDENGSYWIAIGPKVLDPNFENNKEPNADRFNWNVKIDAVLIDDNGNEYYLPCVPGDVKAHTYSNGIYQTGYAFPNGTDPHPANDDGSVIEFMGAKLSNGLSKFKLAKVIVYNK